MHVLTQQWDGYGCAKGQGALYWRRVRHLWRWLVRKQRIIVFCNINNISKWGIDIPGRNGQIVTCHSRQAGVDSTHLNPPEKQAFDIFGFGAQVFCKLTTKFLVKRCGTGASEKVVKEVGWFLDEYFNKYNELSPHQIMEDICNVLMEIPPRHLIQYTSPHSLYQILPRWSHERFQFILLPIQQIRNNRVYT